jgi:hypothetical protein
VHYSKIPDASFQYILDAASVEYIFNPTVLQVADIKNIKQELVATQGEDISDGNGMRAFIYGS